MRVLQDQCPPTSYADIENMILNDTGYALEDLFEEFDSKPLGVASLAQVHKAVLKDGFELMGGIQSKLGGRQVAVKLQHPSLDSFTPIDISLCAWIVRTVKKLYPDFEFEWLASEMTESLPQELNFNHEASNATRVSKNFEGDPTVKIPTVYWSSRRILVMEFIEGGKVDDLSYLKRHQIQPADVSNVMGRAFNKMIFVDGFVHCDPHPGNVFVRPKALPLWRKLPILGTVLGWVYGGNPYNFELVLCE
jgi:aarF domain-containing kinase